MWLTFDAADCDCFDPNDKGKMIAIFEQSTGGLAGFNKEVRKLIHAPASSLPFQSVLPKLSVFSAFSSNASKSGEIKP